MNENSAVRVHGDSGIPVAEVAGFLTSFDNAYSGAVMFNHIFDRIDDWRDEFPFPLRYWPLLWWTFGAPLGRGRRRLPALPEMQSDYLSRYVAIRDRVVLRSVRLESPGFWEFLGKLNALEVVRQYLNDRHERKKDEEYRNDAEHERLWLENELLRNQAIRERVEIARSLGADEQDLAPLVNSLLARPLQALDRYQDRNVISTVEQAPDDSGA